ncbi:hypothetical protein R1flu_002680 [Riccia fluitans]|uniref:Tubulin/FtsZ GTPase domain-containing protein n=1 Tax=Riccia fluitans TaxID=41844 RepID=A0ABD1Y7B6_9MARC
MEYSLSWHLIGIGSFTGFTVLSHAEACESLQSFFMLHPLGGGTGSGVGTYILELLNVCSLLIRPHEVYCRPNALNKTYTTSHGEK